MTYIGKLGCTYLLPINSNLGITYYNIMVAYLFTYLVYIGNV